MSKTPKTRRFVRSENDKFRSWWAEAKFTALAHNWEIPIPTAPEKKMIILYLIKSLPCHSLNKFHDLRFTSTPERPLFYP